jgi:hypothetical protein
MAMKQPRHGERGAILVQVAVSILMLTGFTVFVCDYGVVWLSRAQAQNAADAGALAGAIGRAYDDTAATPASNGKAATAAINVAQANSVFGAAPVANVSWPCPTGVSGRCVRVDVYRNGEFGSATLPVFFGPVMGINSQGVRATATAHVEYGNSTNCMRPWSVVDKWNELHAPVGSYDHYSKQGNSYVVLSNPDVYTPPNSSGTGTGFKLPDDFGYELRLKAGNPQSAQDTITPGWFLPVDLPMAGGAYSSGGNAYRDNIAGCTGYPVSIGDYVPVETGNMIGPTSQGFDLLKAKDPNATWNSSTKTVQNSCAPGCAPFSPRIVPLPVFDMDDFQFHRVGGVSPGQTGPWSQCPGGGMCVRVVNILGFFVDRMSGNDVIGYLMMYPGLFVNGSPSVTEAASFLVTVRLIR